MKPIKVSLPVDCGVLAVMSEDFVKKAGKIPEKDWLYSVAFLEGKRRFTVKGYGSREFTAKFGIYYIGDPGYFANDDSWEKILKKTNYFKKPIPGAWIIKCDDGVHEVIIK